MFCSNCGSQVEDQEKFCKTCGTPVNVQSAAPVAQQAAPQATPMAQPAPTKVKAGPRRACFVVGLITCILLILLNVPAFSIGGIAALLGSFIGLLGAYNSDDLFAVGLLIFIGSFILIDAAIISIVFNGISTKITGKRPASKCRSFRMAAAIIVLVDSLITMAPLIGLYSMLEGATGFFVFYFVVFIMAIVYFVLAIITNSKEKKLASAQ